MPFNYAPISSIAIKLIKDFGRPFTFVQLDSTPTDPSKPWLGVAAPRANPASTLTLYGVFAEPSSEERLGKNRDVKDFAKSAEQVIIVATSTNLGVFDEVLDTDGASYKINDIQTLAPGPTTILHYVRVVRQGKSKTVRGPIL